MEGVAGEGRSFNFSVGKHRSVTKISALIMCRQQVEKFFAEMDRDYDGRLTLEEFMGEECKIEKLFQWTRIGMGL